MSHNPKKLHVSVLIFVISGLASIYVMHTHGMAVGYIPLILAGGAVLATQSDSMSQDIIIMLMMIISPVLCVVMMRYEQLSFSMIGATVCTINLFIATYYGFESTHRFFSRARKKSV